MADPSLEQPSSRVTQGATVGYLLIRKKRKRFSLPGSSIWKKRYMALSGSVLSTYSSENAFNKSTEAEAKHTFHIDSSCTCAPSIDGSTATTFVLTMSQDYSEGSTLVCKAFDRTECHFWISALGRAINYALDSRAAEQILQRQPGAASPRSQTFKNDQGNFDPSSLNSLLRRKSLSTLETSAIRSLMLSLKNEQNVSTTKGGEQTQTMNPALNVVSSKDVDVWYAAFPFTASNDNELHLQRGEKVRLENDFLRREEETKIITAAKKTLLLNGGWWVVENQQGKRGRVPSGYLTQNISEIRTDSVTSTSFNDEIRISLYPYQAADKEKELTFAAGERMHIVERHTNGWYV